MPRLAAQANAYVADLVTADQVALTGLHQTFSVMIVGLITCGFGLIIFMKRQHGLLESAHREVQALADNLNHLAHHDAMTGLANRVLFRQYLDRDLDRLRHQGRPLAVMCLDLDGFKQVNDAHGHSAGDELLRTVSRRLQGCIRSGDVSARLGGDEFAVLVREPVTRDLCERLAEGIIAAVGAPFQVERREVTIGTSIVICIATDARLSADQIMRVADKALYQAKSEGRGRYRLQACAVDGERGMARHHPLPASGKLRA